MQLYIFVLSLSCLFITQSLKVSAASKIPGNKYFLNVNNLKLTKRSSPLKSFHINKKEYVTLSDKTNEFVDSDFNRNHQKDVFKSPVIQEEQPQFRRKYTVLLDINSCPLGYVKVFQKFKYGHGFTFCQRSENIMLDATNSLSEIKQDALRHSGSKHSDEADSSDMDNNSFRRRTSEILNSDKMIKRSGNRRLSIQGSLSSLAGMLRSSTSNRPMTSSSANDQDHNTLKYKLFLIGK